MNKKLKKTIIIAAVAVAVCGAVWGGLTIARNAQRGDVDVYAVSDFSMTDYWGDTSNTSGSVTTDNLQKIFLSSTQTVSKVYVTEGEQVKKGMKLISYDTTLSEAGQDPVRPPGGPAAGGQGRPEAAAEGQAEGGAGAGAG